MKRFSSFPRLWSVCNFAAASQHHEPAYKFSLQPSCMKLHGVDIVVMSNCAIRHFMQQNTNRRSLSTDWRELFNLFICQHFLEVVQWCPGLCHSCVPVACSHRLSTSFPQTLIRAGSAILGWQYTSDNKQTYERRGRVVNTPASYLGGPSFESRPGDRRLCYHVCLDFKSQLTRSVRNDRSSAMRFNTDSSFV
jgi:hypothetical protein